MAKYKVLSTKKLEPSLLKQAREKDIEIIEQEFISVQPIWNKETYDRIIDFPKNGIFHIVLTSANAVTVLNRYMTAEDVFYIIEWKFFCLSGKTKQAILNAPFLRKEIVGEAENAFLLAKKIIEAGVKEIIFFCGNKRREEVPSLLR